MAAEILLGKRTDYSGHYAPDHLCPIPRAAERRALELGEELPFHGEDLWNAWELTWLNRRGKPCVATGVLRIPAESPNLIESKSLKLYLNSLSMTRYPSSDEVAAIIAADLSKCAGAQVRVALAALHGAAAATVHDLPGTCIDALDVECDSREADPSLLTLTGGGAVCETLHSHLLRSNCPVTGQPDLGSILVRYRGPAIDHGSLLRYLVSFRCHGGFHESCVERIFVDLQRRCTPQQLTVYARYNRRGGLDINPFRSDFEAAAENARLWRQ